jgi:flavin-dependent dehydrogenase
MKPTYDVVIFGGGLAGLTLSIQLKREKPDISILILEKRAGEAPLAAFKVGESTVELGSYYLRHVIGLKDYLEEHELPKLGLRFFFKSNNKKDITSRIELGARGRLPTPSHQLDRGTLENHMTKVTGSLGTDVILGAIVKDVEFGTDVHTVTYKIDGEEQKVTGRWVVDASSRASLIKRKLGFQKPMDHAANAVWWRLKGVIDIDTWSDDLKWRNQLEPKLRYLSTVHFLDTGYWLWVIPLGTGNTSIGIVADPAVHPLETFNSYEKALNWMSVNEPLAFEKLGAESDNLMDFMILKHYAHHSGRLYSAQDRWGVTGEAGAFLDPFYSPGTDLISLSNTLLTDLILRELQEEDIDLRAKVYEQSFLSLIDNWIPIYQNKYPLMGTTQIMPVKICWDWAIYWAVTSLLFTNKAFTDINMLRKLFATENGAGVKFGKLSGIMQNLFLEWRPYDTEIFTNKYLDPLELKFMREFQAGIEVKHEPGELLEKIEENMRKLEEVAVAIFQKVSAHAKGTPPDMKVDPYRISLADGADVSSENAITPDQSIIDDVNMFWFYKEEYA